MRDARARVATLRLLRVQLGMSALTAMQYRADFVVRGLIALLGLDRHPHPAAGRLRRPRRASPAGRFPESLVVVAWFTLLRAVLEGAVSPSLTAVVEHVRRGHARLRAAQAGRRAVPGVDREVRALAHRRRRGRAGAVRLRLRQARPLAVARPGPRPASRSSAWRSLILYSIWILVVSASFWVVKVDNLSYFFGSLFDVGPLAHLRVQGRAAHGVHRSCSRSRS